MASIGKYLKRDVTPLLRDLKWINLNSILRLNEASFIYKNLQDSTDSTVKIPLTSETMYHTLRKKRGTY